MVMDSSAGTSTPAQQLVGKELPNGWKVEELIEQPETATGATFPLPTSFAPATEKGHSSRQWITRKALESSDPARALQS